PRRRPAASALPLFDDEVAAHALRDALPVRFLLESPSDTLEHVRAKERAMAALIGGDRGLTRWKRVADVWCAAWFGRAGASVPPTLFGPLADAILTGRGVLPAHTVSACLAHGDAIA